MNFKHFKLILVGLLGVAILLAIIAAAIPSWFTKYRIHDNQIDISAIYGPFRKCYIKSHYVNDILVESGRTCHFIHRDCGILSSGPKPYCCWIYNAARAFLLLGLFFALFTAIIIGSSYKITNKTVIFTLHVVTAISF